jgi:chemotaxis protein CheX
MDVEKLIAPFVEQLLTTFQTMLSFEPKAGDIFDGMKKEIPSDITGTIGMTGDITGTVSLRFSRELALRVASKLVGENIVAVNNEVKDAIGELANIVAGGAKGFFRKEKKINYKIAIPTVIMGNSHTVAYSSGILSRVVPFTLDDFTFFLELCIRKED